jgi:ParB/RepB/Spo0J family partition protein
MKQEEKVDPELIYPNPYQQRIDRDPQKFEDLRASIKANGILSKPLARPRPGGAPGMYQLAFGQGRLEAWRLEFPEKAIALDVDALTDRQMADYAIDENHARDDLSIIETAREMRQYQTAFKINQADLAKRFGYKDQSSVSNVLALLRLPEAVQLMVHRGELPQRHARALVPFARIGAIESVTDAAKRIKGEGDREYQLRDELGQLERKFGKRIDLWPLTFPAKNIPNKTQIKGAPAEISTCAGCEFFYKRGPTSTCLLPPCWEAKKVLWLNAEGRRISRKTGIQMLKPEEAKKAAFVFRGDSYMGVEKAEKAIKSKHESLRLVMAPKNGEGWILEKGTGSKVVALATIDSAALNKKTPGSTKKKNAKEAAGAAARKAVAEKMEAENKESERLIAAGARILGKAIPIGLLELIKNASSGMVDYVRWPRMKDAERQANLMESLIAEEVCYESPAEVRKLLAKLSKVLRIRLPAGWDKPPAIAPAIASAKKGKRKTK